MTDKELMQQALDALLTCGDDYVYDGEHEHRVDTYDHRAVVRAIDAIRTRLAQPEPEPEPEPVVWMYQNKSTNEVRFQKHMMGFVDYGQTVEIPLYTEPLKKELVGLTDEEAKKEFEKHNCTISADLAGILARAIKAKLKEKNT